MRENRVGHANVADVVGHLAQRCEAHAKGHRINCDFGLVKLAHDFRHGPALAVHITHTRRSELLAVGVIERFIIEEAVQEGGVRGIYANLKRLQPIATPQAFKCKGVAVRCDEAIECRKGRRRLVLRPKPAKQHAAALL